MRTGCAPASKKHDHTHKHVEGNGQELDVEQKFTAIMCTPERSRTRLTAYKSCKANSHYCDGHTTSPSAFVTGKEDLMEPASPEDILQEADDLKEMMTSEVGSWRSTSLRDELEPNIEKRHQAVNGRVHTADRQPETICTLMSDRYARTHAPCSHMNGEVMYKRKAVDRRVRAKDKLRRA